MGCLAGPSSQARCVGLPSMCVWGHIETAQLLACLSGEGVYKQPSWLDRASRGGSPISGGKREEEVMTAAWLKTIDQIKTTFKQPSSLE